MSNVYVTNVIRDLKKNQYFYLKINYKLVHIPFEEMTLIQNKSKSRLNFESVKSDNFCTVESRFKKA